MQIVTLQNDILSASLSSNAQAAVFAPSKERHWQHAVNTSIAKVEQALLRYALSPALSQHIEFKLCALAGDMLHAIASKPNVVIVGASGNQSAVSSLLVPAQESQIQQVIQTSSHPDRDMLCGCCAWKNLLTIKGPALVCGIACQTTGEHPELVMAYAFH